MEGDRDGTGMPKQRCSCRWKLMQSDALTIDINELQHGYHRDPATPLRVTLPVVKLNREHLTKTADKLKNRNNLLKVAGSTWGASANTQWSSALALCYSAAEYCAPVWSRYAHTSQVDVQLNSTMRLISGTLRSTPPMASSALEH